MNNASLILYYTYNIVLGSLRRTLRVANRWLPCSLESHITKQESEALVLPYTNLRL